MKIKVTQEDIDGGWQKSQTMCPIASAVARQLGKMVWITRNSVKFNNGTRIKLPIIAREFICNFDEGLPVAPFEFELPES